MPIVGSFAGASSRAYGFQSGLIGDFESISTVTVGSGGASTITFSSIPDTYQHLQIRMLLRSTNTTDALGTYISINFNSDTSAIYAYHIIKGNGSGIEVGNLLNQNSIYAERTAGNNQTTNVFGLGIIDILDYKNTNKFKVTRTILGFDNNGGGQIGLNSGLWRSTAAISTISIVPPSNNFAQYSSFALYGIKG